MPQVTIRRPFGELDLSDEFGSQTEYDRGLGLINGEYNSILTRTERTFAQVEKYDSNGGSFSLHPYRNFRR